MHVRAAFFAGTLTSSLPGMGPVERAQALKQDLLHRLQVLGPSLPNNMLDQLIDELGGTENVAEVGVGTCVASLRVLASFVVEL